MRCEQKVPMAAARLLWKTAGTCTLKHCSSSLPSAALNSYIVVGLLTMIFNHRWDIMLQEHWKDEMSLHPQDWIKHNSHIDSELPSPDFLHERKFHFLELLWFGVWSLLLAAVPNQFWSIASHDERKPPMKMVRIWAFKNEGKWAGYYSGRIMSSRLARLDFIGRSWLKTKF